MFQLNTIQRLTETYQELQLTGEPVLEFQLNTIQRLTETVVNVLVVVLLVLFQLNTIQRLTET